MARAFRSSRRSAQRARAKAQRREERALRRLPAAMRLTTAQRDSLVDDSWGLVQAAFPGRYYHQGGCLPHAVALQALALARHDLGLHLQAGSVLWPLCDTEPLDDSTLSHFGHSFEECTEEEAAKLLVAGQLPGMHVWLADPIEKVLVDPSLSQLRAEAEGMGYTWETAPPRYLWETAPHLEEHYEGKPSPAYLASQQACQIATKAAVAGGLIRELTIAALEAHKRSD